MIGGGSGGLACSKEGSVMIHVPAVLSCVFPFSISTNNAVSAIVHRWCYSEFLLCLVPIAASFGRRVAVLDFVAPSPQGTLCAPN